MPVHQLTRVLPFTPEQLFHLVGDVDCYPQFVPWITAMRTWNRRADEAGASLVDAEAQVGFSFLKERFSTCVRRDPLNRVVEVSLIRGPFKRLTNRWTFHPHPDGCQIDFELEFDFRSLLLQQTVRLLFADMDRDAVRMASLEVALELLRERLR